MILLGTNEARALDRRAMEEYGLAEAVLMENAGSALVRLTQADADFAGADVLIVCGTGNNGGDGFVAARYAAEEGADVTVLLIGNAEHMGEAARAYRHAAEMAGIPVIEISAASEALPYLAEADIVIDALIGTGLASAVTGEKARLIEMMNDADAFVISADVPSGMNADTGRVMGAAVMADATVALGSLKRGHLLSPGFERCGKVYVSSIGIPETAREDFPVRVTTEEDVFERLPRRTRISHKGANGFTGLFAGSAGMEGAGLLAAAGALYAGAGKVALNMPAPAAALAACRLPEVMVRGIAGGAHFTKGDAAEALRIVKDYDAVALGCGFGRTAATQAFVFAMLGELTGPVVVDADALFAVAERDIPLAKCPGDLILTPHVGEFAKLTGLSAGEIEARRIDAAREFAAEHQVVLVLKGAPTVTALPDGTAWVNPTGNSGMATGGMGDTLTGIIAALAGEGLSAADAAVCGVYLHGLAGDILAEKTPVGYTAGDLARALPLARERVMK